MPSERVQRQIDRLLDEAEEAAERRDWVMVRDRSEHVLTFDPENADARSFLDAAQRGLSGPSVSTPTAADPSAAAPHTDSAPPSTFAHGRYQVKQLLGEGGKKRVYLAHDTLLDRDVAFALIKTEGLDDAGRQRVRREAQAMGRLGDHPHIVSVLDLGEQDGHPYLVSQLMAGGDLDSRLAEAPERRLPLAESLRLVGQISQALEHAHSHSVIHRDLKPGNIWLSSDGTAKLGDFGLAVALDQTRHTQPGMMVGTVSYMAPEQAIGGVVDARSDLYALGCVLYELVCGRPPFVGEESVAIITQHLNTTPVAPSWHRPECPPALESLILRLLEKDPTKRPASASEVLQALTAITVSGDMLPSRDALSPNVSEVMAATLYQQTFVGRESELRQLQAAYDAAVSGQGALAMVVGEPGIGKTTLCEQLATYAAVRGGATLVGHCYEEGSLSLPYLPFVEALRGYVLSQEPEVLRTALGTAAGDVARIVSEVRSRVEIEPRPASGDPDEDRWRLLEGVSGFLRNASMIQPLIIVLEDLHWADRGTLDLLQHLARSLAGVRLLIVGTYRDVEVDRGHPLSSALADLRRSNTFTRIGLHGLTVDEVHRMMNQIRGQEVPWSRAEAIHRQTEGNPLFVQEVLRYLVEEGLVVREGGRWVRADDGSPESGIPEGLRDVIGKRLSRLSPSSNQVLTMASVIGRDFRLDVLQRVSGLPEEEVVAALEEAQARAVIEERRVTGGSLAFRFNHAFFRQTLYEEIFAARRIRWHQQVARALEQAYGRRVEEHAAELAEHFANSSDSEDLGKAVHYGQMAARRAVSVYAYGEAVRHLERALEAQEVLDPDDQATRCDLLLELGEALMPLGEAERAAGETAPAAFKLAQTMSDRTRDARSCRLALDALHRHYGPRAPVIPEWGIWAVRANQSADGGTGDRAYADLAMGRLRVAQGDRDGGLILLERALELARALEDPELLAATAWQTIRNQLTPKYWRDAVRLAEEFMTFPLEGVSARTAGQLLEFCGVGLLMSGDRVGAAQAWNELSRQAERSRDVTPRILALSYEGLRAVLEGRLEQAVTLGEQMIEAGGPGARIHAMARCSRALLYLGRTTETAEWLGPSFVGFPTHMFLALAQAQNGRHEDSKKIMWETMARNGIDFDGPEPPRIGDIYNSLIAAAFEVGIAIDDRRVVDAFLAYVRDLPDIPAGETLTACRPRLLAGVCRLHHDAGGARDHLEEAIVFCTRLPYRPELALSHLELAELLLDEAAGVQPSALRSKDRSRPLTGDELRAEGAAHLDVAIGELQEMKMAPFLERALRRKLHIQGVDSVSPSTSIDAVAIAVVAERTNLQPHAAPDGTVTLLFTDIEDSTGLTVRLGDQRWLEILRAHHALIRKQVHDHGGFEVKCQGDGFMLAFGSARRALDCAVAIQRAVALENASHQDVLFRVRMGLHTGEVLKEADDFHGKHVVLAARIAAQARGGEVLVSALVRELTDTGGDITFDAGQAVELKGLPDAQRVFRVLWK